MSGRLERPRNLRGLFVATSVVALTLGGCVVVDDEIATEVCLTDMDEPLSENPLCDRLVAELQDFLARTSWDRTAWRGLFPRDDDKDIVEKLEEAWHPGATTRLERLYLHEFPEYPYSFSIYVNTTSLGRGRMFGLYDGEDFEFYTPFFGSFMTTIP